MTMNAATLAGQLAAISGGTEAAARASWADSWAAYFAAAQAGSTSFAPAAPALANAKADMSAAMVGLSSAGAAAGKVQAGIIAWWDRLVLAPGSYFLGAASITKPSGLANIAADLPPIFSTNQSGALSSAAACTNIANAIHSRNLGGTADISGSQNIT